MAKQSPAEEPVRFHLSPDGQVVGHSLTDWINQLEAADPSRRWSAVTAIKTMDPDQAKAALPRLLPLLSDPSEMVRHAAAQALGGFGSEARAAIGGLIQQLSDPVEPVRHAASASLFTIAVNRDRQIDPEPERALQSAMQGLASGNSMTSIRTQLVMVDVLGTFACVDSPRFRPCRNLTAPAVHDRSIQLLIGIIRSLQLHPLVRERACNALGAFRKQARVAVPIVAELLQETGEEAALRTSAARALANLGPEPESIRALARTLADPAFFVRREAAWALGELGPGASAALPALNEASKDSDDETRRRAAIAIERIDASGPAP